MSAGIETRTVFRNFYLIGAINFILFVLQVNNHSFTCVPVPWDNGVVGNSCSSGSSSYGN